jgi:Tol biopolymer transport system component
LNNGAWSPDGQYIVARKHFTSGRSLGAGEICMYHISGGNGLQLTIKKNDQQDVNEPVVSPDGRYVYFSEDLYPGGFFITIKILTTRYLPYAGLTKKKELLKM